MLQLVPLVSHDKSIRAAEGAYKHPSAIEIQIQVAQFPHKESANLLVVSVVQ